MLGRFRYMGKPDKMHTAPVKCIIHMFVMHVAEELEVWPEMAQRQRFWVSSTMRILLNQKCLPMRHNSAHLSKHCMLGSLHQQSEHPKPQAMSKACTCMRPGCGALYLVSQLAQGI